MQCHHTNTKTYDLRKGQLSLGDCGSTLHTGRAAIGAAPRGRNAPGAERRAYRHWGGAPGSVRARCQADGVPPLGRRPGMGTCWTVMLVADSTGGSRIDDGR